VRVVRQLAQAVLGLSLLGLVARLLVAAITEDHPADRHLPPAGAARPSTPAPSTIAKPPAGTIDPGLAWVRDETGGGVLPGGDIGGDAQLAESFSVRFHHRKLPGAMVTYCYYAAIDLDDLTTICVEQQTELLVCTDPADPGGTEIWADARYTTLHRGLGSVETATTAAHRAAECHLVCDEPWSGRPPWTGEQEGTL
jgi:hypothetical protein